MKVEVYEWEKPTVHGSSYEKVLKFAGTLLTYSTGSEEHTFGVLTYPVAVVQDREGWLHSVPVELVRVV